VQREIASQTRWVLAVLLAAVVLYPLLSEAILRLRPGKRAIGRPVHQIS